MSDKYVAYPEYKDSGVGFLNKLPFSWGIKKVNYLFSFGRGLNITKANLEDSGVPVVNYGEVHSKFGFEINPDIHNLKRVSEDYLKTTPAALLQNGDFVFADTSEDLDGAGNFTQFVGNGLLFAGYHTVVLRPNDGNVSRYLAYVFESTECRNQIRLAVKGVKVFSITQSILKDVMLPMPPPEEQIIIAAFLDYETARIDQLIAKQQRLIELLKEKRQAVISHVVTKGLNPNAPMKDSGVEWLGQVPEHWVVTKAKYVSQVFVPQRNKPELNESQGYPWVTMEDMTNQYVVNPSRFVSSEAMKLAGSRLLSSGSVIASCVGNLGVVSINTQDVIINQQLQAFIPTSIKAEYLKHIVRVSKPYFELIGTAATLVYVNQEGFENMPMLVPSAEEQEKICHLVSDKDIKFMTLIAKAEHQVKLLQERRTALISAAVTGKIDVRGWNAPN